MEKQKTVAIIGASSNHKKYGYKAMKAYSIIGYKIYPINPNEDEIDGVKVYKSILDVPDEIDRATMYVPPKAGLKIIEDIAKKGVKELYFNPGSESDELIEKAKELGLNPILACSILAVGVDPKTDLRLE